MPDNTLKTVCNIIKKWGKEGADEEKQKEVQANQVGCKDSTRTRKLHRIYSAST